VAALPLCTGACGEPSCLSGLDNKTHAAKCNVCGRRLCADCVQRSVCSNDFPLSPGQERSLGCRRIICPTCRNQGFWGSHEAISPKDKSIVRHCNAMPCFSSEKNFNVK
jgi:hypothetical protein